MHSLYKYATAAVAGLFCMCGVGACSNNGTGETDPEAVTIQRPEVMVSEVTTTGFTLRWEEVKGAGSYIFSLDGGEEFTTSDREIVFNGLERQREYVVAIKASPKNTAAAHSPYTYVHVTTDDIEQLAKPTVTLGSAYSSRTLISWTDVPEAASYEYTIDGKTTTTDKRQVTLSGLARSREYTFRVRALTGDATRFNSSDAEELVFTVSEQDIPAIVISPIDVISDAMIFEIYTANDMTYYYEVIPASSYERIKGEEAEFLEQCRQAIIEIAQSRGISIQLALASMLESGTKRMVEYNLTQELSYEIIAFGMNLSGEITTELSHTRVRTTADGYSKGPNFGGGDWFRQTCMITNDYYISSPFNCTNSIFTIWKGTDVVNLRYRTLPTSTFNLIFPDPNDVEAITEFLSDENYSLPLDPSVIEVVNSPDGFNVITECNPGISYTLSSLATSTSGEQILSVNSISTKTQMESLSWFTAGAVTDEEAGETHDTVLGVIRGLDVAACRYALFSSEALANAGYGTSDYARIVEERGNDVAEGNIPYINGGGLAMVFRNASPLTEYTFIATATNSVGDTSTRWATVMTTAAPAGAPAAVHTRSGNLYPLEGTAVDYSEQIEIPAVAPKMPERLNLNEDPRTIVKNLQILK